MNAQKNTPSALRPRLCREQAQALRRLSQATGTPIARLVQQAVALLLQKEDKKQRLLEAAGGTFR